MPIIADFVRQGRSGPLHHSTLLRTPECRRGHAAGRSMLFSIEVGSVRDRVREPLAGEIRLQWWRDVIEAGSEAGQGSPVAEALMKAVAAP